jgi:hypothetical protein
MVRGIFTGKVRLDYARHRHALWLAEMEPAQPVCAAASTETTLPETCSGLAAEPMQAPETHPTAVETSQEEIWPPKA